MTDTPAGRPTLETVARLAGVSRASVSRVVNGASVRPAVLAAVTRAVEELGYVPNPAARTLVTQRTDVVAFVLPEPATRVFSDDAFFPALLRGVGEELEAADKQLLLLLASTPSSHERILRYVHGRTVDGVVLASLHGADPLPAALDELGIPVVASGRPLGPTSVPYVDVEQVGAAEAATRHLLSLGRRRVATITGPLDMPAGIDRLAGYRRAVEAAGFQPLVAVGEFTRGSGVRAMEELLTEHADVDAVFVASDLMADGALRVLREAGLRVPGDVAVAGFDDVELARFTDPPLTTVRQPIDEIGRRLARQVLRRAAGEEIEPALLLPTELVVRRSA